MCIATTNRSSTGNNCDIAATNNAGCGVEAPSSNSYGPAFNSAGGGWYAMERTNNFIKVWFWSRNAGNVPSDVKNGATSVNTDKWVCIVSSVHSYRPSWRLLTQRVFMTCCIVLTGHAIRVLPKSELQYLGPLWRAQPHHQSHTLYAFPLESLIAGLY